MSEEKGKKEITLVALTKPCSIIIRDLRKIEKPLLEGGVIKYAWIDNERLLLWIHTGYEVEIQFESSP